MKSIMSKNSTGKTCQPRHISNGDRLKLNELQSAYDEMAAQYEKRIWLDQHLLGVARQRKQLMSRAQGRILDVACGTGLNFSMFAAASEITAIDLSPRMLEIAGQKANALHLNVQVKVMDAQNLEFPDGSFNTVTSSLSTCTFSDPIQALREMRRVCHPDGLILLLEHGHSNMPWLADYQDRNVLKHYHQNAGCRWNQDPLDLVSAAGLRVVSSKRFGLGMFYSIVATPNA
jgi:ubiquinone/menaquinone biosynthesis C-methylase UbiE